MIKSWNNPIGFYLHFWYCHYRPAGPQDWPDSLKDYVQRAFASCDSESDKDKIEAKLKEVLTNSFKDGTAWTKDWDKQPLPG